MANPCPLRGFYWIIYLNIRPSSSCERQDRLNLLIQKAQIQSFQGGSNGQAIQFGRYSG
jgi:hypothetical protein